MSSKNPLGDSADRSQDGSLAPAAITAEQLQQWRSQSVEFFSEVRARLNRVSESLGRSEAAADEAPRCRTGAPLEQGRSAAAAQPHSDSSPLGEPTATTPTNPAPAEPPEDHLSGSLVRLEEIRRQLAARLDKS